MLVDFICQSHAKPQITVGGIGKSSDRFKIEMAMSGYSKTLSLAFIVLTYWQVVAKPSDQRELSEPKSLFANAKFLLVTCNCPIT